ncbi:MAG: MFS transporter [Armatimonadetes bacterium]|nr:MAG: MFS transporter [Armatimonadota bacterium]
MSRKVTFSSVIKNRGFRFLWINQILVQLAYNTLNFALIIWVFKLMGTHLAISGLMLAVYLPAILFGLFAGVLVDISDRRKLILLIDLALAVSFIVFIFIWDSYLLILLNTFIINSLAQFFIPAEGSFIPLLVKRKQFFLANSLFSLTLYGTFMVGFSIGGPLLNHFGMKSVFLLGSFILLLAFFLSRFLPTIRPSGAYKRFSNPISIKGIHRLMFITRREVASTFKFIHGKLNIAIAIALLAAVQGVVGMLAVIMPSYMERVLLIHATDSSYFIILPLGFGIITGALVIGRWFSHLPRRSLVIPALIWAGILFSIVALAPKLAQFFQSADFPAYLSRPRYFLKAPSLSTSLAILAYGLGICLVSIIIPCQTVLQENATGKNRGKIFSVLFVLMTAFSAIPVLLAGLFSDLFGVTPLILIVGLVIFILGIIAWRPGFFFRADLLPKRVREFLGFGHWEQKKDNLSAGSKIF